jgi:hypothetical protein
MRISGDRYSRERLRLDLALRFLRNEARTQIIRAWTGLTDDSNRKVVRSGCALFNRNSGSHHDTSNPLFAFGASVALVHILH